MSSASLALVINCGSSSLKITFKDAAGNKTTVSRAESGHNCALKTLFAWLADLALLARLCAPGHAWRTPAMTSNSRYCSLPHCVVLPE